MMIKSFSDGVKKENSIQKWEETLRDWGYEKELEEIKFKLVFDSKEAEKQLSELFILMNVRGNEHHKKMALILEEKIGIIREKINKKLEHLKVE